MKKTLLFALLSVLSVVLGFTSCCDTDGIDEKGVPVADITFSVSTGELILGGDPALATTKLTVIVTPENATEKSVVWSSSDETVATVSEDGVVTAVGEGTAIITATAKDGSGKSATYTVTVNATSQMKAKFDISEQYTKVRKGSDNVWTRAAMTQDGADFKFAYEVGDKVEVTNIEILRSESPYYTFTLGADDMFYSKDAKATETATMWIAVFPEHEVSLANQSGKLEDLSKVYQLLGSANTTGAEGLDIKMNATCAVLVIDNQKGDIDINVTFENGKWVETMVMGQHGEASDTKVSLLKTSVKGKYYIVVPAKTTEGVNLPLNIYDGENKIMSTKTGLTAGCYYDLTVAEAPVSGEEWTKYLYNNMDGYTVVSSCLFYPPTSQIKEIRELR